MTPYWFNSTLAALPAVLWMVIGLGLPWALAALPRKAWRDKPLVAMVALAFGPALMTAWMFVLGTLGGMKQLPTRTPDTAPLLSFGNILLGSLILALIGIALAWRKRNTPVPFAAPRVALAADERILVLMIGAALVLRFLSTAFWNFTAYDTLWVYGYQGRLYSLLGYIPASIGYYPPFVQLQYVYAQLGAALFTGNVIDDHAARSVIMLSHLGSILAAYALGKGLFNRRVGIFAAALWGLYPHVGEWAQVGDLEIPLTFAFTGAAAFLLKAWLCDQTRRERLHHAALAGLFLSIAMWTKPTAGAFILGVGLLVGLELLRTFVFVRHTRKNLFDHLRANPRLEIAVVTGLASIPLGALWYLRNIVYGHPPITMPHPFWLTQALRSGAEFGWLVLALLALIVYTWFAPRPTTQPRPKLLPILTGLALIAAALMPTIITPYTAFNVPNRMDWLEWLALVAGLTLIGVELWRYGGKYLTPQGKWDVKKIAWALALALPYFITWFYSYSYHYRLSFAIVPLLALPTAVILARWIRLVSPSRQPAYRFAVLLVCLPGVFITLHTYAGGWDWLWSNEFPDDFSKQEAANRALAWTVKKLETDILTEGLAGIAVIVAPGLQRLPFFFPLYDVRTEAAPTQLAELSDVDYYVYTQEAAWYYPENRLPALNQITGSIQRTNVMQIITDEGDSSFWSLTGRLRESERRFSEPRRLITPPETVQFGDFAAFTGHRFLSDDQELIQFVWRALKPAAADYTLSVRLLDEAGNPATVWDAKPVQGEYAYYATTLWEAGEYITEQRSLKLPEGLAPGEYTLSISFYEPESGGRVPVRMGDQTTDAYSLSETIRVPAAK
jgi:hypothetical protein